MLTVDVGTHCRTEGVNYFVSTSNYEYVNHVRQFL